LALSGERHRRDPARGYGLPGTVQIITELDGELLLASGLAATRVSPGRNMERRLDVAFSGTIFEGAVPARSPIRRHRRLAGHRPPRKAEGREPAGREPRGGESRQ